MEHEYKIPYYTGEKCSQGRVLTSSILENLYTFRFLLIIVGGFNGCLMISIVGSNTLKWYIKSLSKFLIPNMKFYCSKIILEFIEEHW